MTKTVLSLIGLLAVGTIAYMFATGEKPQFVNDVEQRATGGKTAGNKAGTQTSASQAGTQQPGESVVGKSDVPAPKKESKTNDPKDPLTWDQTMIRKEPARYFKVALADAQEKYETVKAREANMRAKQLELQRKVNQKVAQEKGTKALLEKAIAAWKAADEKFKDAPEKWVAQFPYERADTSKNKMKHYLVKLKRTSEMAYKIAGKYTGANEQYKSAILVAENRGFELEMTIESLKTNLAMIEAGGELDAIGFDQDEVEKYTDMSEVYMAMDGGDKALEAIAQGSEIESKFDAELGSLGIKL